jgi:hypothetical protein
MNDQATTLAAGDSALRQGSNLEIAKREAMALNAPVDLPRPQIRTLKLTASTERFKA